MSCKFRGRLSAPCFRHLMTHLIMTVLRKNLTRQILAATFIMLIYPAAPAHERTMAPVLKDVMPAVVNISVTARRGMQNNPLLDDPFFRRFFNSPENSPQRPRRSQSVGSGVIIDARKGHVVTNHHVVDGAEEVTVTLQDRRKFTAELVGSDSATDIALLKIDSAGLTEIDLGDSSVLQVGDFVSAIGNPFGLGQTVTSGIVSALGRSGLIPEGYEDFIQTDASINPGNSGGALIDYDGRLVGINTAIIAPAGGNVGIGFAVPVNMVKGVVAQLLEHGEVHRGQLGVMIQDVTPDLAAALELENAQGALVSQVVEDSPADDAGIEVGDVVVGLNGEPIADSSDLRNRIGLMQVGEKIEVELIREGRKLTVRAHVGEAATQQMAGHQTSPKLEGANFRDIGPTHQLYGRVEGVEVASVESNSRAWRIGLRPGDIVLSVNRKAVSSVRDFSEAIDEASGALALLVQRGQSRLFLVAQ